MNEKTKRNATSYEENKQTDQITLESNKNFITSAVSIKMERFNQIMEAITFTGISYGAHNNLPYEQVFE